MMSRPRKTRSQTTIQAPPAEGTALYRFGGQYSPLLEPRSARNRAVTAFESSSSRQSSLLQTVIRNLEDSVDEEERQTQRVKLESDLAVASERINTLVRAHKEKLRGTLVTFEKIDGRLQDSQEKVQMLKRNLQECKTLLRCKRDELKRLWVEDVKYKNMLKMIDIIEEVRGVPELLKKHKQGKHFLHATELLKNNFTRLEGELANVEALKDLRTELRQQKEHLHEELIDELHRHLYVKPTAKRRKQQQQQNSRSPSDALAAAQVSPGPPKRVTALPPKHSRSASRSLAMEKEASGMVHPPPTIPESDQVVEDLSNTNPEANSSHYMAIIVESLSFLNKVGDAVEAIQHRMEREFLLIIERASVQVTRTAEQEAGVLGGRRAVRANQPRLLLKLLQSCFKRFRSVVSAHSVLLFHLQRAKRVYKANYVLYEEGDVWAAVQHVLQNVLEVYLAFDEESSPQSLYTTTYTGDKSAHYAVKKKALKGSKKTLFRFDSSRHAISVSSYMREQRDIELAEGGEGMESVARGNQYAVDQPSISQHLVCKPSARNITVLFGAVRDFVLEIEEALKKEEHCGLYYFLHEFVEQRFLDSVKSECVEKVEAFRKSETAKAVANDQKTAKVVGTKSAVFNSVIVVWQLVEELRQLMRDLPMYSTSFLEILLNLLTRFKDSSNMLYRDLITVVLEGARGDRAVGQESVVSSKWARDKDINRMIRSLPNWIRLRQGKPRAGEDDGRQGVYAKESETLTTNLGSEVMRRTNVVLSPENLRLLAILHESVDWFNGRLKQAVMELTSQGPSGLASPAVRVTMETTDGASLSTGGRGDLEDSIEHERQTLDQMERLSKIQFDFQFLSEMTIIMLHLEVRCHCFYFLNPTLQRFQNVSESEREVEPQVRQLATDLKDIDMVMSATLTPEKYRYLFEGLGHLIAAVFITSVQHMRTINKHGIKKVTRNISELQSCLATIALIREKDLYRARRYFDLFFHTDEEVLLQITEAGPMFSQKDYSNALVLIAHSQPSFDEARLKTMMEKLDKVFSRDSV